MFEISTELKELADKVFAKVKEFKPVTDSGCRIAYQYADKEKKSGGKTVYADTMKVSDKMKAVARMISSSRSTSRAVCCSRLKRWRFL